MVSLILPGHNNLNVHNTKTLEKGDRVTPLPYSRWFAHERNGKSACKQDPNYGKIQYSAGAFLGAIDASMRKHETAMHNRALEKLLEQLDIAENMFEAWYERKEAYTMLGQAGAGILDFLVNWKKPQYWKRHAKSVRPSTLPEAWITYQFGVKPLIGTVDTMLKGLGQPLPSATFSGSCRQSIVHPLYGWGTLFAKCDYIYKLGCTVECNPNPNVALSNIAGLTTPFSTAWSVVPWGWAVDYFFNVSQLLTNFEVRHPGVTIKNSYLTRKNSGTWFGTHPRKCGQIFYSDDPTYATTFDGVFHYTQRSLDPSLNYKPELKFPLLGSNKTANLFSAIALTMKGKSS